MVDIGPNLASVLIAVVSGVAAVLVQYFKREREDATRKGEKDSSQ